MAESDSPRLGLRRWSAGTDSPSRTEFDTGNANLDLLTAIDKQGTFASRPAPAIRGTYYWDTTNNYLWRDDGAGWFTVGSRVVDSIVANSATGVVPHVINALAGQTANLFEAKVNGTTKFYVDKDGGISTGPQVGVYEQLVNTAPATRVLLVKGAAAQTADLITAQDSAATDMFRVLPTGAIVSTYGVTGAAANVLGANSTTPTANQTQFASVTPALELRSTVGGAGTYNDLIAVRHASFDGTAVKRKLGIQFKMGAEIAGDVAKAGGMYVESLLANAATPRLALFAGDTDVLSFDQVAGTATLTGALVATGQIQANTAVDNSFKFGTTGANLGYQGTGDVLLRAASTKGFYFYAGGSWNTTPGNAGGGATLATLTGAGLFSASNVNLSSTSGITLAEANPAFMIGGSGTSNLIVGVTGIQARNNGAAQTLALNPGGGDVVATGLLQASGGFKIGTNRLTISASAPGSPATGDIWIDT